MDRFIFDIDVVGACNLKCPSCPQGNIRDYRQAQGFMEPELLARILAKASGECRVSRVSLFSWAEPLLHPQLSRLVRTVHDAGTTCYLSSNLNILPNIDAVMAENPATFRISASGFTQDTYGYYHRGGNIERVKKHMAELAQAKKRHNATTRIYVYYHRYRDNLREEPLMRQFAADLGIEFEPAWALVFPLEKILHFAGSDPEGFPLTAEDKELIARLAVPLAKALEITRAHAAAPCPLRDEQVNIDFQGNALLCCGVFDARRFTLGSYLALSLDEIQRQRRRHELCGRCMPHGAHVYLTQAAHELEWAAAANIAPEDAAHVDLQGELARKRLQQRLGALYRRFFAGMVPDRHKEMLQECFHRCYDAFHPGKR